MKVLRIESVSKRGVYQVNNELAHRANKFYWKTDLESHREWHPMPDDDTKLGEWWENTITQNWYFGFKDEEQLTNWFPKDNWEMFVRFNNDCLPDQTLGIGTYEVDEFYVRMGDKQLCFELSEAKRVSFEPFHDSNVPEYLITLYKASNMP